PPSQIIAYDLFVPPIQLDDVADAELAQRRTAWQPRPAPYTSGVLAKYARLVSTASRGAVTD
ncbi:MAG: dihydroxy-acid dehydratase, partial [Betaproteobacteria bacterium]|nr:dihydroxy-acid dehydratase [Betaproteobacteria bacterium]